MRNGLRCLAILLLSCGVCMAGDHDHGVGVGVTGGQVDVDGLDDELDFEGFTIFGKIGFTSRWGLLLSFRDMEDDENLPLDGEIEYDQLGVHAVYMWRDGKRVRPHVKLGLVNTDAEVSVLGDSASEDDTSVSLGGGLEAGSDRVAFYGDFDYTEVEIDDEDFEIANVTMGVVFKF